MEIVFSNCCGLDVHKKAVTACVITPKGKEIRTFGTMTRDLLTLSDWISSQNCTRVAMEQLSW